MATIMMRNTTIRSIAFAAGIALLALAAPAPRVLAQSASWNINNAGNWSTAGNWLNNAPGSTSSTTSTDIATFGFTLTTGRAVTVDNNRNIGGIIFSNTSAFGYTLSSGNLLLSNGGVIQSATNNGAHTDTISSAIAIQGDSGSGTFTAGATSASSLLSIGAVTGVSTAGNTTTLTLNGDNTGANAVTGVIGNGSAGGTLAVVKSGNGVWVLSGANTFTGGVTLNSGTLRAGNAAALGTGTLTFGGGSLSSNSTTAYTLTNTMAFTGNATLGDTTNTGALTLSGNADLGGATRTLTVLSTATFGGVVSNGGLTKDGAGTFVLNAANTFTGTTAVNRGTLALDFSAAAAPATNILSTSSPLAVGGGTLQLTGKASTTNSQTVNGLAITPGASQITLTANATANPLLLTLGGISRSTGGTLNLTQPASTIGATNGFTTTTDNTSGILGGWITVAGADWATNNGTNIVALASYTANTWAAGNNTNVTANGSPAADSITNSLRFNTGVAATVTLSGNNTITSGGILVGTTVGSRVSTITGGTLRGSSGGDLVVFQNNTSGNLVIASQIVDNTSATALTKSGAALLALAGANTYTGTTFVNAGTLQIGNGGTTGSIATSSPVSIAAGATLAFNRTDNFGGAAFTNAISGAGSLTMTSGTLAVIGNGSGFTGTVNAAGGQMNLDFSAVASTTDIFNSAAALSMTGGELQVTGKANTANAQTLSRLTIPTRTSTVVRPNVIGVTAGAGGSAVLNLGAITRGPSNSSTDSGGTVMFSLPAGTQNATNGITTNTTNTNGILGGWATIGQTDWATNQTNAAGGNIVALGSAGAVSSYTSSATAGNTAANYANANVDMVSSQTLDVSAGTINTLRFNDAAARTLTLSGTNSIGASGIGGILVTPAVGANLSRITGGAIGKGNLGSQADEIIINQFNTQAALQIDSNIVRVGNRMNIAKNGAGMLILTGNANFGAVSSSGKIDLNAGTIQFGDGTGGTFDFRDFGAISYQPGTTVSVAAGGTATLPAFSGNGGTLTVDVAANARLNGGASTSNWIKTGSGAFDLGTGSGFGSGWAKEGTVIINNAGTTYAVNSGLTIGDTAQNAPAATVFIQSVVRTSQIGAGTYNRTGTLDLNNQMMEIGSAPTFVGGGTVTSSNVTSGTGLMIGNLTYNAANAFDTGALIEKVTLSLGTADRTFTINDSAAVATEMTVSSNITGTNGITKAGAGTMLFSGTNTYTGATTVSGALVLSTTAAVTGTAARPYTVNAAGAVATGFALDQTFLGRVVNTSAGAVALGANSANDLNFSSGGANFTAASLGAVGTGTWAYTGTLTPNGTVYRLGGGGGTLDFQGALTGASNTLTVGGDLTGLGGTVIVSSATNSYGGATTVQRGILQISSLTNAGSNSSTGTNATINLSSGTSTGTLRYVGSGNTSNRTIDIKGTVGGIVDASGSGALNLTSGTISVPSNTTVTLTGSSTANNSVGAIAGTTGVNVNKTGPGLWRLTAANGFLGRLTVTSGTIVATADVPQTGNGVFGGGTADNQQPLVGDATPGAMGQAAVLLTSGVLIDRGLDIAGPIGATQEVILGMASSSGTATFGGGGSIRLGRDVTLQAADGGTAMFLNGWRDAGGGTNPNVTFNVGSAGNAGTVIFGSFVPDSIDAVNVRRGTLRLDYQDQVGATLGYATPVTLGETGAGGTLNINGITQQLGSLSFTGVGSTAIGSGTLQLFNSGSGASANVTGTAHQISAAMTLADNSTFTTGSAARLLVSSAISGSSGYSFTKAGPGILELSGTSSYSGDTFITDGQMRVNGQLGNTPVTVQAGATLGGSGRLAGTLTGDGLIAPGNSPGILTVDGQITPTGTTSFAFELTSTGTPTWSNASASVNDVLRLTNADPFTSGLGSGNVVNVYFDVASLANGDTFLGGFFVDNPSSTANLLSNELGSAVFQYFVRGDGLGGFAYNDTNYYSFAQYKANNSGLGLTEVTRSVVNVASANFAGGTITTGQVTQFVIVPEPGALALAGIGVAAAAWAYRRRRS
jgi:fibronectin-binding autotransporter adhesin